MTSDPMPALMPLRPPQPVPTMAMQRTPAEWAAKLEAAKAQLTSCLLCGHRCAVDRTAGQTGPCRVLDQPMVSAAYPHMGEELFLRGGHGCGMIYCTWCNMGCKFCQNFEINLQGKGQAVTIAHLTRYMLELEEVQCPTVAWVTPTHQMPFLIEALHLAVQQGFHTPIVYNCGGYETPEALEILDGLIDVYLPDFKYWDEREARRVTGCPNYPEVTRQAILEMFRQVGHLQLDYRQLARRGLVIRHLVMPGRLVETEAILTWIAEHIGRDTCVSLMAQYKPMHVALQTPGLDRALQREEYADALAMARRLGLCHVVTDFDPSRP